MDINAERLAAQMGLEETRHASATNAAPGAGVALATLAALPAGEYEVEWTIALTGTAETNLRNLQLRVGATVKLDDMTASPGIHGGGAKRITIPVGGANLTLNAKAAATAGSVYTTSLRATRLTPQPL